MKKVLFLLILNLFSLCNLTAQVSFKTVYGKKAKYSLSIPSNYVIKSAIGANVDIKYADKYGASIITVVRNMSAGVLDSDIDQLNEASDWEVKSSLESTGLQNVTIINKGYIYINGRKSFFVYYKDYNLYYHTITQFRKGKLINLTYACKNSRRDSYMPYIFRVVNSLK
jgi:hypothetical protein